MQLNPDCIREILFVIEEVTVSNRPISFPFDHQRLSAFSKEEMLFHLDQCNLSGYLSGYRCYLRGATASIGGLTPSGHAFLSNIREDTTWSRVKRTAKTAGSYAIDVLAQVAATIVAEFLKPS